MSEEENKSGLSINYLVCIFVVLVAIVLTATVTYLVSSNRYLDELDGQNQQIRDLQNVIRKTNGLQELEETQ